jgi:RNA polymerase sigma-70 factor (ECF subfamily)
MEDDVLYVKQCQEGDPESFGVLYDRYLDKIYRFVYYKVYAKEVAEDITSEVFQKALEKIKSFDASKGTFSAWLYRIARNSVIDHYRKGKDDVSIEDTFDVGFDERTPETLDAIAALSKVSEYLETLTAKQREIIVLRVWEELSYQEIAAITGGSEDSVKMAFSRSIRELRDKCGVVSPLLLLLACGAMAQTLHFHDFT